MTSLSIIIVAKNEAANIVDCVRSARFADEVIVLDSRSTDSTADLARQEGATVVTTDWPGYGPQNNRGIDMARGDWFYSLDADERITPELAAEIRAAIDSAGINGYRVPRRSMYCGYFMKHGGWWPDYTYRLARKGQGRFTEHYLHAHLAVQGATGSLTQPMIHYSYRTMEAVLEKVNRYSSASVRDAGAGRKGSVGSAIGHGLWAFVRTYFVKLGFLDGRYGFMLAVSNAETSYYKYIKLMLAASAAEVK